MLQTRLTRLLGIKHPVIAAPMDSVVGGRLAAAVSSSDGFGLIGGGWHGREAELDGALLRDGEKYRYFNAMKSGDAESTAVWVGEAVGLIRSVRMAAYINTDMVAQAERVLHEKRRTFSGADIGSAFGFQS